MEMKHRNRVYNSISSKRMLGVFITNLQASLYACINDEGFNIKVAPARLLEVARERGDNRGQCNRLQISTFPTHMLQQTKHLQPVFVWHPIMPGRQPPRLQELGISV
jgi:hypothetical protein